MAAMDLTGWTLVFDLDGTLVDTAPDLHASLNHSLATLGLEPVPFHTIKGMIGQGAKAMIKQGLAFHDADGDGHDLEALWTAFLSHYSNNICHLSRPYPGAEEELDAFSQAGAICAVCTNKTQTLAEEVLAGLSLASRFAAIRGADAVPAKKPDGDHIRQTVTAANGSLDKAIMIGDSQTDERAARNAGLPFIFVDFGYGPAPLAEASDMAVASTYVEVGAAVRRLAG